MVNNVIGVVNYVIAARPSLLNFVIADTLRRGRNEVDHARDLATRATGRGSAPQTPNLQALQAYSGMK